MTAADFEFDGGDLVLSGDWTATTIGDAPKRLRELNPGTIAAVSYSGLGRIDTTGAYLLAEIIDPEILRRADREDVGRLLTLIEPALEEQQPQPRSRETFLIHLGRNVLGIGEEIYLTLIFVGQLVVALGRTIARPSRLRLTPLVSVMQSAGINAIPIVATMTFFIGAVVALVGANLLTSLGASVFTVQLVGVSVLREFGVLIPSVLLAGRSASSFAAQLGAMRMNQETDAIQVMGIDRFDALVVPRVLALFLTMPLLSFAAMIAGLAGGLLVSWAALDISPVFFLRRTLDTVPVTNFWVGMSKVPLLSIIIAATGCRHGMEVEGDVVSLGGRVTTAVVQSIFAIIMFDALFAIIFMKLDL